MNAIDKKRWLSVAGTVGSALAAGGLVGTLGQHAGAVGGVLFGVAVVSAILIAILQQTLP